MDEASLRAQIDLLEKGEISPDELVSSLKRLPFADLGEAKIDHHRHLRQGLPEAVYGPGKSVEQCLAIVDELMERGTGPVVVTRLDSAQQDALTARWPEARMSDRTFVLRPAQASSGQGNVAVITAGTADTPVAAECAAVLEAYGFSPDRIDDVGVAGLHRLLAQLDRIHEADLVVVAAGMEGALASVMGGLVAVPVIAVPTSVGYGAGLDGVTALLSMHASCAAGVTVVGIDNGYGAAVAAARYLNALNGPARR